MGSMDFLQFPKGHLADMPDMEIGFPGEVLILTVLNHHPGLLHNGEIHLPVNQYLASFGLVALHPNHRLI